MNRLIKDNRSIIAKSVEMNRELLIMNCLIILTFFFPVVDMNHSLSFFLGANSC